MQLQELLSQIKVNLVIPEGNLTKEVKGLSTNSHTCQAGYLFIGMPGSRVDGGEFWATALEYGAIAAIVTPAAAAKFPPQGGECLIQCNDIVTACASVAAAFYGFPADKLTMIGVTGTNGKTTITHLIEFFLERIGDPVALLGTLYTRWKGYQKTAQHTTPFAVELQKQLAEALSVGSKYMVMEVSSHALAQGRIKNCSFEVAIFSNLTQDHLDFHQNMEDYFESKALLFSQEYLKGRAIINLDDPYGQALVKTIQSEQVWTYSVSNNQADFYTSQLNYQATGVSGVITTPLGSFTFDSPLVGQFNIANLLAAIATITQLKLPLEEVLTYLPHFPGVPGRMERVNIGVKQDISVIVDYAHTPDSLENLLTAARPFIKGKMICVFGCGGDRDKTKRPLMGKIAAELADQIVVTSDNPRTENPQAILEDILVGIPTQAQPIVIADRALAIKKAIETAQANDGILIAGKGHEDYQILGTEKIYFDDRQEAIKILKQRYC